MKTIRIKSHGTGETYAIGQILGCALQGGDVVALIGELGTGKTHLTQGIAKGLGVPEGYLVTSPTFTLINEYPGRCVLYHLDVYRLSGSADLEDMGYEEYFFGPGVTVIEWAEKVRDILPDGAVIIEIDYIDENTRNLALSGQGGPAERIIKSLKDGGF